MANLGDELRKVLLAGVGAVATTVEKGQELIDLLAKKGEITVEQGKALSEELGKKMKQAYEDSGIKEAFRCPPTQEEIGRAVEDMTPQERDALRRRLEELAARETADDAACETPQDAGWVAGEDAPCCRKAGEGDEPSGE